MATGKLGTGESQLGQLVLAAGAVTAQSYPRAVAHTLSLSQTAVSSIKAVSAQNVLSLSQAADVGRIVRAQNNITLSQIASTNVTPRQALNLLINLSQVAHNAQEFERAASNALTLAQTAVGRNTHVTAVNALALTQTADNTVKARSASNALSLAHTATGERIRLATNTLTLSQTAILGQVPRTAINTLTLQQFARIFDKKVAAQNTLNLAQVADSNIKGISATNTLALAQTASVPFIHRLSATNFLTGTKQELDLVNLTLVETEVALTNSASLVGNTQSKSARNHLFIHQSADGVHVKANAVDRAANNTLNLANTAILSTVLDAANTLAIINSADAIHGNAKAQNTLTLGQVVAHNIKNTRLAQHTLSLLQTATYLRERNDSNKQFDPSGNLGAAPTLTPSDTVTFTYPFLSPTTILKLRAPNFNNLERFSFQRIQRETRGGTLVVFADDTWPKIDRLVVEFRPLKESEGQSLLALIGQSLGQEIGYLDHEGRQWRGVIANPDEPFVRNREDVLAMQIELEAQLV